MKSFGGQVKGLEKVHHKQIDEVKQLRENPEAEQISNINMMASQQLLNEALSAKWRVNWSIPTLKLQIYEYKKTDRYQRQNRNSEVGPNERGHGRLKSGDANYSGRFRLHSPCVLWAQNRFDIDSLGNKFSILVVHILLYSSTSILISSLSLSSFTSFLRPRFFPWLSRCRLDVAPLFLSEFCISPSLGFSSMLHRKLRSSPRYLTVHSYCLGASLVSLIELK